MPILPSPSKDPPYYQQLSYDCFKNGQRPDLDVVNALNKAKIILNDGYKIKTNDKIFLNGYSTSGVFAQRFSLIHPELVDAVCIGGASGTIPIPNSNFDYPIGTKNFEELFKEPFNLEEYKKIPFTYYVAGLECEIKSKNMSDENGNAVPLHDMSYNEKSTPKEVGNLQRKVLGQNMFMRAENTTKILRDSGFNISHVILPETAHNSKEAHKLTKLSKFKDKDIEEIQSIQTQLISAAYYKYIQREKENKKDPKQK